jgi:glucose-1-phosphatase
MEKIDLTNIKNIIFDLGNVLYDIRYENIAEVFKTYGITNFEDMYGKMGQVEEIDLFEEGKISPAQFRDFIRTLTTIPLTDNQIDHAWNAIMVDIPMERVQMLIRLKDKYKLYLYSNTNQINCENFERYVVNKFGYNIFETLFIKAYYSHTLHIKKPKPEGFSAILKEQNLNPDETIFIDDLERHIKGAQAAGFRTYHHVSGEIAELL